MNSEIKQKPVFWICDCNEELKSFPKEVRRGIGVAIMQAQCGSKSFHAKPLKGFGGSGILEVVEDFDGNTYRAVYTVKLVDAVYVLHVFQKKSKAGIKTPKQEIELIKNRLKRAKQHHAAWQKGQKL